MAGIGINILASGLTAFLLQSLYHNQGSYTPATYPTIWKLQVPALDAVPLLGPLLNGQSIIFFLALASVPLSAVLLFRTRLGLHIRATGESPEAVAAAGVDPVRMKFIAILLSGLFGGLAGAQLSMATVEFFVHDMTNGRGFIGLAATLFAGAAPVGTFVASLIFGVATATSDRLQASGIPSQFLLMVPYLVTVVALAFASIRRELRAR